MVQMEENRFLFRGDGRYRHVGCYGDRMVLMVGEKDGVLFIFAWVYAHGVDF